MPSATKMPRPGGDEPSAGRRRFTVKMAAGVLALLALLYAGFHGRQDARRQVQVEDISLLRNQLQQKLEEGQKPSEHLEVEQLANALKNRLGQFQAAHRSGQLSEAESFDLRLSKATLANSEQRFNEALELITADDSQGAGTDRHADRIVLALRVRGDSFHGLRQWRSALDCAEQVLARKPNHLATLARVADCQFALGKTNEARTAYARAAKLYHHRGDAFLAQGKPDAAIGSYGKAVTFHTRLTEGGAGQFAADLANSHSHLGSALLSQQRLDSAIAHYEKAIEIQSRLVGGKERSEAAGDLALTHNNRGAVRRLQGKLEPALADFELALKTLATLFEPEPQNSLTATTHGSPASTAERKLDVILVCSEDNIDVQTRSRPAGKLERTELAVILALLLKNRGHAYLAQHKAAAALGDFRKATELLTQLVEQEGEADLAPQLALSLGPLAWVQATSPDPALRDGRKAREYALKACALSEWKSFAPLQSLAAAHAEMGEFAEAVKWQQAAVQFAPPPDRSKANSRLELYKAGKPFRMPAQRGG